MERRCDQKADCDDQTDETSCQIVHVNPVQYLKDKPPPPLEVGDDVKIFVNVDITRVLSISEVDGIFETQQSIGLEWRDPRLQLYNLRPSTDSNTLLEAEKNQIWIPSVTFVNTATQERSLRDNSSLVTVARKGGLVRSSMEQVLNIYIYEGSENPFLITRVYSTKWLCSYDMLLYPFDTQSCLMRLA